MESEMTESKREKNFVQVCASKVRVCLNRHQHNTHGHIHPTHCVCVCISVASVCVTRVCATWAGLVASYNQLVKYLR